MAGHRSGSGRAAAPASVNPGAVGREGVAAETSAAPQDNADLAAAQRVLRLEAAALDQLAATLDGAFTAATARLHAVRGHIARKIAATLASSGTPALFVHPAEASHGDLGMVTREDAVLALSNSGETNELADLVAYTRRFAIPLIAVTGRAQSSLAEAADIALILPSAPEACPLGLAPTTSTTLMLALGDALAIALLERKGFSAEEFQVLHPGGNIGRRLLRVSDIMHTGDEIPLTSPEASMSEAILVMTRKHFGCVGVLDGAGRLIGIITDGDLRRHMGAELLDKRAAEVMTRGPQTIRPRALAAEALGLMNSRGIDNRGITSLFVVEEGRPIGILHIHDCLRAGVT